MVEEKEGQIDLDEARIFTNGKWLSEEDLKKTIKDKVSSEDYDIATYANSVQSIKNAIENSKELTVRFTLEQVEALEKEAKDKGESIGNIVRSNISSVLGVSAAPATAPAKDKPAPPIVLEEKEEPKPEPEEEEEEEEEAEDEDDEEEEDEDEDDEEEEDEDEGEEENEEEEEEKEDTRRSRRDRRGRRRSRRLD